MLTSSKGWHVFRFLSDSFFIAVVVVVFPFRIIFNII
jgi:hypothetical protein